MATVNATEAILKEAVESDGIVLVDFWAEWCGPCKAFAPIFEKVSEKHEDITFAKVNTDQEQRLAAGFQIQSIPTLMLFRDGVLLFRQPGLLPENALEDVIQQARDLDMDEVRKKIAEHEAEEGAPS
ncbi:MAG TPA: thioredoxin [Polyangiaceae bacterium LLY-WYZ-15_(1-7)]|nr:thioredoxin [Myxococcales bacterium]MAT25687.1 thioredoxin [Sandaracinus sp.]HJK92574.1 thioredoxin [Polyangiaceae bacterium LLY-WYZ-15_(1-7)]HJL02965.1 thioredoxin [Polyangiaceae bacterium LLY-WYZ-15_(1-7)]HJL13647.1 thioredoxin [Polyangiaceae bacterium LLY-WYZ-15_(1-7)]